MNVLYISRPSYFDLDLSLINNIKDKIKFTVLLDLPPGNINSSFLSIESERIKELGILSCTVYKEFESFKAYLDLDNTFIINRFSTKNRIKQIIILQKMIYDFIEKLNPDVIHCNDYLDAKFIYALLRNKRKIVITIHDPIFHSSDKFNLFNKSIFKLNYKLIHNYILLNSNQKEVFKQNWKIKEGNIFVASLGIYEYLQELVQIGNDKKKKYILFFGRIQKYKGLDYLLKAFQILENNFDVELIVAGEGNFWFDINDYISDKIKVLNRYITVNELANLIVNSLFVVCPYIDATQSGVIMSSYALGKPVIATRVGGLEEMVVENHSGLLVEPKSVDELSQAISRLLSDSGKTLLSMNKYIKNEYENNGSKSWQYITNNLISIYKSIS